MADAPQPEPPELIAVRLRFELLVEVRDALRAATERIDEGFTPDAWVRAWESSDMDRMDAVALVERYFERLVNALVEVVRLGLRLTGERPPGRLNAPGDLDRLRELGAISEQRRIRLTDVNEVRNKLQHEYPELTPLDVHRGVLLVLNELPGFTRDYRRWLEAAGIDLAGPADPPARER